MFGHFANLPAIQVWISSYTYFTSGPISSSPSIKYRMSNFYFSTEFIQIGLKLTHPKISQQSGCNLRQADSHFDCLHSISVVLLEELIKHSGTLLQVLLSSL